LGFRAHRLSSWAESEKTARTYGVSAGNFEIERRP
jgi:hypothetical protein